ncbi:hypothetical protein [Thiocystis violacea]|uniref:hypothetical protein n=1 Tax=Thiocystis violacea TaxID=13725 RepID=UPI00190331A6|nr:hypothetical protein [Thiocystis violacea]MBK1723939.1 hypothetical protein [Thiocystis violacea]
MSDAPFDLVDAKDSFTDTDWFNTCQATQMPYVVVRSGDATADVLWDFVTLPPSCDAKLRANFAALERDARAIFDRFALEESYLRVKPTMICFDHLPFDEAKQAASELYRLIAAYLPARQRLRYGPEANPAFANKVQDIGRSQRSCGGNRRLWVEHSGPSSSAA